MVSETAQSQVQIDNPSIQFPFIHMNGNSGTALSKQYFNALTHLLKFEEEFYKIEFHARDYYPLGDQAFEKARAERELVKARIAHIRTYLELHAAHCFEAAR